MLNWLAKFRPNRQNAYISHTGVVVHWLDHRRLLSKFKKMIPKDWEKHGDHMTINVGPANEGPAKELVGRHVELKVVAIAQDERVLAVKVETRVPSNNNIKHITLAVSPEGQAHHSNELKNWKPIETFTIRGIIKEVEQIGQAPKEKVHTPQSAPAPDNPQEFVAMMTGKPEFVIRQALKGKFPEATPEQIDGWIRQM